MEIARLSQEMVLCARERGGSKTGSLCHRLAVKEGFQCGDFEKETGSAKGGGQTCTSCRRDGSIELLLVLMASKSGVVSARKPGMIVETPALVPVSSQLKPLPSNGMQSRPRKAGGRAQGEQNQALLGMTRGTPRSTKQFDEESSRQSPVIVPGMKAPGKAKPRASLRNAKPKPTSPSAWTRPSSIAAWPSPKETPEPRCLIARGLRALLAR